jgi:hypothetical protein
MWADLSYRRTRSANGNFGVPLPPEKIHQIKLDQRKFLDIWKEFGRLYSVAMEAGTRLSKDELFLQLQQKFSPKRLTAFKEYLERTDVAPNPLGKVNGKGETFEIQLGKWDDYGELEEESPDLAKTQITHPERNARLKPLFYQGKVFRLTAAGWVHIEHFWKEKGFWGWLAAVRQYAQHPFIWLTAALQARFLKKTVYERLDRIRGPGSTLAQVAQSLPVTALAQKLGITEDEVRLQLLKIAASEDIFVVRSRLTLHPNGPMAHARVDKKYLVDEPEQADGVDVGIWLGEKLFSAPGIEDEDIALLLLEESQHILAPDLKHDVILHSPALLEKLQAAAVALGEAPGKTLCELEQATPARNQVPAPGLMLPVTVQPPKAGQSVEALAGRPLSSLESGILRVFRFLFTPELQLKPDLRWLPFQRLLGLGLRLAVRLYLGVESGVTMGNQTAVSPARLQSLLAQDAVDTRRLDLSRFEIKPLSQAKPIIHPGVLGGSIAFENGKSIIFIPDRLLEENQGNNANVFLYDLLVWANAREIQNLLVPQAVAGSGWLRPVLALGSVLPFAGKQTWHRWWMSWQPQAYLHYLQGSVAADSQLSRALAQDSQLRVQLLEWTFTLLPAVQDRLLETLTARVFPDGETSFEKVAAMNQLLQAVPLLRQERIAGKIEGEEYYLPEFSKANQRQGYWQKLLFFDPVPDLRFNDRINHRRMRALDQAA